MGQASNLSVDTLFEKIRALETVSNEREGRNNDKFNASKEAVQFALAAAEKAVIKAETAAEKRFESVNEFRNTLKDQQATLLPRAEFAVQHQAIIDRLAILEEAGIASRGKSSGLASIGGVLLGAFAGLSTLTAIGALVFALLKR